MKTFVLTSDKYSFLLEGYSHFFNKYWDDSIEVTVLCFDKPNVKLPENFTIQSLGKQSQFSNWSDALIPVFSKLQDDRFFMCFEDHFLIKKVDTKLFDCSMDMMDIDKSICKVWTLCKPTIINPEYSNSFYKWRKTSGCLIPSSLLPSVWKTDYFNRLLRPNLDCHSFEVVNDNKLNGKIVIYPKEWPLYPSLDAMRYGRFNDKIFENYKRNKSASNQVWQQDLLEEDIQIFRNMRKNRIKLYG